jgi:Beta-ketoacyl synthase, N-terminal domain
LHEQGIKLVLYAFPYVVHSTGQTSNQLSIVQTEKVETMAININEAIAVVGLDLKFPGDAASPESFYEMMLRGRSALSEIPSDRYNPDSFYHPDAERAGTVSVDLASASPLREFY